MILVVAVYEFPEYIICLFSAFMYGYYLCARFVLYALYILTYR